MRLSFGKPRVNFDKLIRELRLMKDQPGHRYYAALVLILLVLLRYPLLSAVAALFSWHGLH